MKKLNNPTKNQLNKEIERLTLELHTKKYIHIPMPSWIWFGKLVGFFTLLALNFFNFLLIKTIWIQNNLGYVYAPEEKLVNYSPKFADLIILYPIIGQYLLICLTTITFVSLFKKLKTHDEEGLIAGLIAGLIYGLIVGLIVGLIYGLIAGLIAGLIYGLIAGLIVGLIAGLIAGLIIGLTEEII